MPDRPAERPPAPDFLPADVRDRLIRLLAAELANARDAALAAGAEPRALDEIVIQRGRSIEAALDREPDDGA